MGIEDRTGQLKREVQKARAAHEGTGEPDPLEEEQEASEKKGADPSQAIELMQQIADQIEPLELVVIDGTQRLEKQSQYIGEYREVAFQLDIGDDYPLNLAKYRLADGEWNTEGFDPELVNQLSEETIKSQIEAAIDRRLGHDAEIDIPDKIDGPLYCGNTGRKLEPGETPMPVANYSIFSQVSGTPMDNLNMRSVSPGDGQPYLEVTKAEADLLVTERGWQMGPVPKSAQGGSAQSEPEQVEELKSILDQLK